MCAYILHRPMHAHIPSEEPGNKYLHGNIAADSHRHAPWICPRCMLKGIDVTASDDGPSALDTTSRSASSAPIAGATSIDVAAGVPEIDVAMTVPPDWMYYPDIPGQDWMHYYDQTGPLWNPRPVSPMNSRPVSAKRKRAE